MQSCSSIVIALGVLLFLVAGNQTISCEESEFNLTLLNTFKSMNFGVKKL
jgi:hypothetical protein